MLCHDFRSTVTQSDELRSERLPSLGRFSARQRRELPRRVSWVRDYPRREQKQFPTLILVASGIAGGSAVGIGSTVGGSFNQVPIPVTHQPVDRDGGQRDVDLESVAPGPEPTMRDYHDRFCFMGSDAWNIRSYPRLSTRDIPAHRGRKSPCCTYMVLLQESDSSARNTQFDATG